ncbi:MAG: amidase family protein [Janthinobacterium lividum]
MDFSAKLFTVVAGAVLAMSTAVSVANAAPTPVAACGMEAGLEYATVAELIAAMESGDLTSERLVTHLLARIERLNEQGPQLRAVIETNAEALELARVLDAERAEGNVRGALHGIPVLLKDSIETADALKTAAGSLAMVAASASRDAPLVANLRASGALILGKANMSEWANFRGTNIPNGWSGRGGQTLSAYGADYEACGSSSGSAVAVAAGFAPLAVGTETLGSIICPALHAGVVGLKPTQGLIVNEGIVPLSVRQDTAGPMARTVADSALLLAILQGDESLAEQYQQTLGSASLDGKRIGFPVEYAEGPAQRSDQPLFLKALAAMREAGAQLVPISAQVAPDFDVLYLLLQDFKTAIPAYLQSREGLGLSTLEELIEFNRTQPGNAEYNQAWMLMASNWEMTPDQYTAMLERVVAVNQAALDAPLEAHTLDALVFPTAQPSWAMAASAGYPSLNVPTGHGDDGLPGGMTFIGKAKAETDLLALAAAYEGLVPANCPTL